MAIIATMQLQGKYEPPLEGFTKTSYVIIFFHCLTAYFTSFGAIMKKLFGYLLIVTVVLTSVVTSFADVRIKQRVTMGGQKFESTRSIKGSRERTEQRMEMSDPAMADFMPQIATITQCDLRRTVRLNDRKQLYMVEPFSTAADTPAAPSRPTPAPVNTTTRKGGTLTMSYNVRDTGERKTMFGLQARHLIISQEMESSPDSCNGPNKTKMEFDGWYVDFSAEFSCPIAVPPAMPQAGGGKPDCIDRIITKGSGTAPKGFLIEGTMKMFGPDGSVQMTQTTETLELSRAPLDLALFDIPQGYRQVTSSQDLYAMSMPGMGDVMGNSRGNRSSGETGMTAPSRPLAKSVAVNLTLPSSAVNQAEIDQYVRDRIASRGLRAVSGTSDYTLNIQFRQIKESTAGKIGGIFGRVTGVGTNVGKVDIDMTATLSGAGSGEAKVKNKFDGPASEAVRAAIDQALNQLLSSINN